MSLFGRKDLGKDFLHRNKNCCASASLPADTNFLVAKRKRNLRARQDEGAKSQINMKEYSQK